MSNFDNLRLDNQLCFALYTATNSITRFYRSLLNDYDLTYPQYLVLVVLWEKDGIAIKDVMRQLKLDSGTLSPIIKRLQSAELVEKVRTDEDERVVRLFLTDKAKQLEPLIAEVQTKVACKTDLSSSEFFELLSTLNELTNSLNKREEAAEKVL
ncbi:MAG: MarR family transcriptional regulator [Pseudomonadota bacterium]|jgi:DNA-binding MarR family transcriptional regulator|uniref:Transcriptional regulator n=1 Tax=Methylophaga aminisulfidivorans MP TaxID=1026882 RepID=F5SWN3_9GAMM|nr:MULTISPECIES: MarR family transcriptional regulator [Methylophaga]EGL55440.1 transcriptional regulator [Methylophaga aminisulfidivorans MP]MEC9413144.1 MarR family transcriptional regulator [Pseudomonadota bacterium]WVI86683.1 MarR family transcriptional regulator [Methylophaga thalassica]